MNETTKYFPCKIYNNGNWWNHEPTFAILSMTLNFGIEDAIEQIKKVRPENIFIIVNGQQTLYNHIDDETDEKFGRALCGIDRQGQNQDGSGKWRGEYKIYTTYGYPSVASIIFDDYGSRDLIIDVVNAKYEYSECRWEDTESFDDFAGNLKKILDAIGDCSSLQFFIAGFSRGGMFSLRLAEWLIEQGYGNYRVVVTIDPVQKKLKERTGWDVKWADWKPAVLKKNRKWELSIGPQWQAGWNYYKFPILRATAEKHYNVFERGRIPSKKKVDAPIGCAVDGAEAPPEELTGIRADAKEEPYKLLLESPYDQFDITTGDHTIMPRKYSAWIIEKAHEHFILPPQPPPPSPPIYISISPQSGLPKTGVEVTKHDNNFDKAYPVLFGDKPLDTQNVNGKLVFQVPDIKPGKWDVRARFEELYSLPSPFYVEPYIVSCEPSECYIDTEVKIMGCFPLVNNVVLFDGKEVPFIIDANGSDTFKYLLFKIPDFYVPKHEDMIIQVLHNGQFYSNAYKPNLICLIGNLKSKELHTENCWCVKRLKEKNKNYFCTLINGLLKNGWDKCHWCLGGSER